MAQHDIEITAKVIELLETRDLEVARDILKINIAVDDLHLSVFKAIASPPSGMKAPPPPPWTLPLQAATSSASPTTASRSPARSPTW